MLALKEAGDPRTAGLYEMHLDQLYLALVFDRVDVAKQNLEELRQISSIMEKNLKTMKVLLEKERQADMESEKAGSPVLKVQLSTAWQARTGGFYRARARALQ